MEEGITVQQRVMFGARGCGRSEDSGGVNQHTPYGRDVLLLKQECAAGQSTVEKCTWMCHRM